VTGVVYRGLRLSEYGIDLDPEDIESGALAVVDVLDRAGLSDEVALLVLQWACQVVEERIGLSES